MKNLILTLFILILGQSAIVQAQCISSVGVGNYSANGASFSQQQVAPCNFAGDYATVTVPAGV